MKRLLLIANVIVFICVNSMAQQKLSFSVLEFEQDVFDTSAKSAEHGKKDGNGSWYAIIKVTSNNPDDDITACQFNFGNMASKVEKHDEALWVYVQRNAKKVTISRPGYHTISQYDLQTTIEAGANYKMVLTSDRVQQQVVYDVKMQMVKFQTSPVVQGVVVTATNQETGERVSIGVTGSNGAVSKALNYGRYAYEALSTDNQYSPSEGIFTLNNSSDVLVENVVLRPILADASHVSGNNPPIGQNPEPKDTDPSNGHEYVDLGLPSGTLWATCNLGAETPEGYGTLYYWSYKKDVARETWGGYWRLPEIDEIDELIKNCKTKSVTQNGVKGLKFVGPNGNSIFIPGANKNDGWQYKGNTRNYMSATGFKGTNHFSRTLEIAGSKTACVDYWNSSGRWVRPVMTKSDSTVGMENGHEYVDLGLPSGTLWATCNLGTYSSTNPGDYFAWGETSPKEENKFNENNYKYKQHPEKLPLEDDAAHAMWGGKWRMPTKEEFEELMGFCIIKYDFENPARWRYYIQGPNGNKIFLQGYGYCSDKERLDSFGNKLSSGAYRENDADGYYWTSEQYDEKNVSCFWLSHNIDTEVRSYKIEAYRGLLIRPVFSK